MLQAGGTSDRAAHTHTHIHIHAHQSAEDTRGPCLHSQPSCSATQAIRVGRDNCNCRIKSSDKQLICLSRQERNPLLNDVRIYTSVFAFGPSGEKTHKLNSRTNGKKMCWDSFGVPHLFTSARQICCLSNHISWTFMRCCVLCVPTSFGAWVNENFTAAMCVRLNFILFFPHQTYSVQRNRGANY